MRPAPKPISLIQGPPRYDDLGTTTGLIDSQNQPRGFHRGSPRDTVVTVTDTLTRVQVTQATTKVLKEQPSALGRIWRGAKDNLLWLLLILVTVVGLRWQHLKH